MNPSGADIKKNTRNCYQAMASDSQRRQEMIENEKIIETVKDTIGQGLLLAEYTFDQLSLTIESDSVYKTLELLRDSPDLGFAFLTDICGVHYPEQPLPLGVVYHLHNMAENVRIRVKTYLPINNPEIQSVTGLFASANWMERETFDFYGIIFKGHPNLKRILNVEYLDYFPLRKEYPLEDPTREDKDNRFFGREAL